MPNEADTCRKYVVPLLQSAGWDHEPHSIAEQRTITDGRIVPLGKGFVRKAPKRVDYLLRYMRDFPLAVVEAKAGILEKLQYGMVRFRIVAIKKPYIVFVVIESEPFLVLYFTTYFGRHMKDIGVS